MLYFVIELTVDHCPAPIGTATFFESRRGQFKHLPFGNSNFLN